MCPKYPYKFSYIISATFYQYFCSQKVAGLAAEVQQRCFSTSPLTFAAAKVAMSKFDSDAHLPYDKLEENIKIVKKRWIN